MIPIRKISATEAIVESLKNRIQEGEFSPGDRFPSEQILLQEYNVSRLTLREALAKLSAFGIIEVKHGKGAFVKNKISIHALDNVLVPMFPSRDLNRLKDLEEARSLIESEIAAKAAEKRTKKQIQFLEQLFELDLETVKSPEEYAERDFQFHLALAEIAGNQFFLAMYQALYNQISTFLIQYAKSIKDRKSAMDRHRPILEAIIQQDVEKARSLGREHAGICASYVEGIIETGGKKNEKST